MNWPLTLDYGKHRLRIPGPGRFRLSDPGIPETDTLLNVAQTRLGAGAIGWLPESHALIENLTLWENILLPTAWHTASSMHTLSARLADWMAKLGLDEPAASAWLARSPRETGPDDRQRVAWLRALLPQPELVFIESGAWNAVYDDGRLAPLLDELLSGCALLVVDPLPLAGFSVLAFEEETVAS